MSNANTPLQSANLTLREDLTLQLAVGETSFDVSLDIKQAYVLAAALLSTIERLAPWVECPDAPLINRAHDLSFQALRFAMSSLFIPSAEFNAEDPIPKLVLESVNHALAVLTILDPAKPYLDCDDAESTPH